MEWYINDLSLDGQFASPQEFRSVLEPLLQLRLRELTLRQSLYCSRMLPSCKATATNDFRNAILLTNDKNFIALTLQWVAKAGPFWDDDRYPNDDDYFEYLGTDVTDQGLGETARRCLVGCKANAFSFVRSDFEISPLSVQHGLKEEPIESVEITNHWQIDQLIFALNSTRFFANWNDVLEEITRRFHQLVIAGNVMCELMAIPFSSYAADRIFVLLDVLNRLVIETDEFGHLTSRGMELHNNHFVGGKSWFSDESATHKNNSEIELTFPDPSDASKKIVCFFHGKVKTPQIRIHFEWPRPAGQRAIKIVYIGPKITKE